MIKRDVVISALKFESIPYVPWNCSFTVQAKGLLQKHYNTNDIDTVLDNHMVWAGNQIGFFEELENNRFKDFYGVVWNRTRDKDIGVVEGLVLPEPTLENYSFPDPTDARLYSDMDIKFNKYHDCFRIFPIGFSLYERAWALRGMENLMMDFIYNPEFVHKLLSSIVDFNIAQIRKALEHDIDAVYFGDDWGQQTGLQMGPKLWHQFILPQITKMYAEVKQAGKFILIHSCGKVDELFDDLVKIGLNCFNPFQPEVMDTESLIKSYHGKLAFHGGLSTQKILPYGSVEDVHRETRKLLDLGKHGGYIFAPAHAVGADVKLENMIAFIEDLKNQSGFKNNA